MRFEKKFRISLSEFNLIKNILKRYKYPPDEEQKAIDLVLIQAEQFSEEWSVN